MCWSNVDFLSCWNILIWIDSGSKLILSWIWWQAQAMVEIVKQLGWTYVSTVAAQVGHAITITITITNTITITIIITIITAITVRTITTINKVAIQFDHWPGRVRGEGNRIFHPACNEVRHLHRSLHHHQQECRQPGVSQGSFLWQRCIRFHHKLWFATKAIRQEQLWRWGWLWSARWWTPCWAMARRGRSSSLLTKTRQGDLHPLLAEIWSTEYLPN